MANYRYTALDAKGRIRKGRLDAANLEQATRTVRADGLTPTEVAEARRSLLFAEIRLGGPKAKPAEFTLFCRQMATLYKAGIHMVESVRMLGEQAESKSFKSTLLDVAGQMSQGVAFSEAVVKYPTIFSDVFVNMVRAGEVGGNLDDMLDRIAQSYEKEYATRQKVRSAMIYPALMSIVMVLVVMVLMIFVVPKMVGNFINMGMELPLPTRILIALSDWLQLYFYIPVLALASIPVLYRLAARSSGGKYRIDLVKLKLPVFGKLWHKQALARFARTFSSMYAASIPMMQLMSIVSTVIGNEVMARQARRSLDSLRDGESIVKAFEGSGYYPVMMRQMLAVGEKTGQLDVMMGKAADFYEAEVDHMADRLKTLLEPMMIMLLTVVVGGIVLAVMLPSFKLIENMY